MNNVAIPYKSGKYSYVQKEEKKSAEAEASRNPL